MNNTEHVIVLHGLAFKKYWMTGVAHYLKKQGYIVHNVSYPSLKKSCHELVNEDLLPLIHSLPAEKIHFVVHSMGGILIRLYAQQHGINRIGRVVMLGAPNQGSHVADYFESWRLFKYIFGKAGAELVTHAGGIHARLGAVDFECGVIAGSNHYFHFPINWIVRDMPRPNDGIVTVENTKVSGMKDHFVLWADHTMLAWHPSVWRQAAYFLKHGCFLRQ
jgi:pimeloyl-ACP methyl ester carboxylesterase